jgi:hypothetical protein
MTPLSIRGFSPCLPQKGEGSLAQAGCPILAGFARVGFREPCLPTPQNKKTPQNTRAGFARVRCWFCFCIRARLLVVPKRLQKTGLQPLRAKRVVRSTTTVEATGFSPWNNVAINKGLQPLPPPKKAKGRSPIPGAPSWPVLPGWDSANLAAHAPKQKDPAKHSSRFCPSAMLVLLLYQGTTFSRAEKTAKKLGFSPCARSASCAARLR